MEGGAEGCGDVVEFDHIESALPGLVLGHERLRHAQGFGDAYLGESGVPAQADEQSAEALVLGAVQGLLHKVNCTAHLADIAK